MSKEGMIEHIKKMHWNTRLHPDYISTVTHHNAHRNGPPFMSTLHSHEENYTNE